MLYVYVAFIALVVALLALDLGVFHRKAHVIRVREALGWSAFWVALGVSFAGIIYLGYEHQWLGLGTGRDTMATPATGADGSPVYNDGSSAAIKYLTGYVMEKSLAVDNIFVIAMIFTFCRVSAVYQHRVLFWGILGALVMRGAMIGIGAALVTRFDWVLYIFGAFLVVTGLKMLRGGDDGIDFERHWFVRGFRRLIPTTARYHGPSFWVRAGSPESEQSEVPGGAREPDPIVERARRGALLATPLLLALLLVEITDVVFAIDSIPAIFSITTDPFLVFTSNVFAILGLRSLYFALASMVDEFRYLKLSLSLVLVVIGTKMLAHDWLHGWLGPNFHYIVLGVVGAILSGGVIGSLIVRRRALTPTLGGK